MVDNVDLSPQAGSAEGGQPSVVKSSPTSEEHNRRNIIGFKVTHILLTTFFLWLTYVGP